MISPQPEAAQYRQLASLLAQRIESGELAPGARFPSERDLQQQHGLARDTVRRAVAILRLHGLITVQHGSITRVAEQPTVDVVRVPRGSRVYFRRATATEALDLTVGEGTVVAVLVDSAGREHVHPWTRVAFTFS